MLSDRFEYDIDTRATTDRATTDFETYHLSSLHSPRSDTLKRPRSE